MIRFSFILFVSIAIFTVAISCNNRQKSPETVKTTDTLDILKLGDSITTQVQKVLLENVMLAIKAGGPAYAVTFCNEKAMPLTDSMAKLHNCLIQRVSDKYRNPDNKPTVTDSDILAKLSSSNPMKPVLVTENGNMVYYKPIIIAMPACLKCHGSAEKDIDLTAIEIIRQKYPNDLATGYKEGDLRGLWKITFLSE